MVDQAIGELWLASIERLLQRIEYEARLHGTAHAPTYDTSGKYVNDEGHVQPALPSRNMGKVRNPLLIWVFRLELPIDLVQRAGIDVSGIVVRTVLPRCTPCSPMRRIKRSTVQRATWSCSRLS